MGDVNFNVGDNCISGLSSYVYMTEIDQFRIMEEMVCSALWQHEALQGAQSSNIEEPPTEYTQQYYNLLAETNTVGPTHSTAMGPTQFTFVGPT